MSVDAHELISSFRNYLVVCRDMGIRSVDLSPGTWNRMAAWRKSPPARDPAPCSDSSANREVLPPSERNWFLVQGNPGSRLVFVSDTGPVDQAGDVSLYDSPAGELFTNILKAMKLDRDDVLLLSFRYPPRDQGQAWSDMIRRRISRVRPHCICTLGDMAARVVLGLDTPASGLRGRFHGWQGIPVMATLHPMDLINDSLKKRDLWEDVKLIMGLLDQKEH